MSNIDKNGVVLKYVNCPGSHTFRETEYYVDDDGYQQSRPGRLIDWYAYIQASKSQCDLSQIIARYLSGDSAVVNVNNPIYGDIAAMPRNINELHDLGDRVQTGYDNLPDEVKGIFGNSFDNFYQAVLSGSVSEKIQAYATAKAEAAQKAIEKEIPPREGE